MNEIALPELNKPSHNTSVWPDALTIRLSRVCLNLTIKRKLPSWIWWKAWFQGEGESWIIFNSDHVILSGPFRFVERCATGDLRNDPLMTARVGKISLMTAKNFCDFYLLASSVIERIQSLFTLIYFHIIIGIRLKQYGVQIGQFAHRTVVRMPAMRKCGSAAFRQYERWASEWDKKRVCGKNSSCLGRRSGRWR